MATSLKDLPMSHGKASKQASIQASKNVSTQSSYPEYAMAADVFQIISSDGHFDRTGISHWDREPQPLSDEMKERMSPIEYAAKYFTR
ncbi:hypothetical protein DPMN_149706 [Dreissena polymorpha]|uniref:Uncharacterized protein n=1 Tax=Dreissena polymorpha TaxID=45954 RepID=A0A9D4FEA2_DREPO|nr:hypothetical protein DPMN_149706 [Dreissena polymorpha]